MPFIRSIGRWSLVALVINEIIGSSTFGLPSELTRLLGRASPIAILMAAGIVSLIVACMAEVASQFKQAGGGYLYVRTAFGRFAGLQVGWFWILASIGGGAACSNLFAQYLGSIWSPATQSGTRIAIITFVIAIPVLANYVGVRSGASLSNTLTVAKLLPLLLLIVLGLVRFGSRPQLMSAVEFTHPGTGAWLRLQFVTVATLGTKASEYPVAETASLLLRHGSLFVAVAVMIVTYGWISADILASPRIVYAFAETGDAPRFLGAVHPSFQSPNPAIVAYASLTWVLAVTGTFLWVAAVSAASSLILYGGVCASLIRLRKLQPKADAFRIPFGPVLAILAIGVSLALISALDRRQVLLMGVTAGLATANWGWAKRRRLPTERASHAVIAAGATISKL